MAYESSTVDFLRHLVLPYSDNGKIRRVAKNQINNTLKEYESSERRGDRVIYVAPWVYSNDILMGDVPLLWIPTVINDKKGFVVHPDFPFVEGVMMKYIDPEIVKRIEVEEKRRKNLFIAIQELEQEISFAKNDFRRVFVAKTSAIIEFENHKLTPHKSKIMTGNKTSAENILASRFAVDFDIYQSRLMQALSELENGEALIFEGAWSSGKTTAFMSYVENRTLDFVFNEEKLPLLNVFVDTIEQAPSHSLVLSQRDGVVFDRWINLPDDCKQSILRFEPDGRDGWGMPTSKKLVELSKRVASKEFLDASISRWETNFAAAFGENLPLDIALKVFEEIVRDIIEDTEKVVKRLRSHMATLRSYEKQSAFEMVNSVAVQIENVERNISELKVKLEAARSRLVERESEREHSSVGFRKMWDSVKKFFGNEPFDAEQQEQTFSEIKYQNGSEIDVYEIESSIRNKIEQKGKFENTYREYECIRNIELDLLADISNIFSQRQPELDDPIKWAIKAINEGIVYVNHSLVLRFREGLLLKYLRDGLSLGENSGSFFNNGKTQNFMLSMIFDGVSIKPDVFTESLSSLVITNVNDQSDSFERIFVETNFPIPEYIVDMSACISKGVVISNRLEENLRGGASDFFFGKKKMRELNENEKFKLPFTYGRFRRSAPNVSPIKKLDDIIKIAGSNNSVPVNLTEISVADDCHAGLIVNEMEANAVVHLVRQRGPSRSVLNNGVEKNQRTLILTPFPEQKMFIKNLLAEFGRDVVVCDIDDFSYLENYHFVLSISGYCLLSQYSRYVELCIAIAILFADSELTIFFDPVWRKTVRSITEKYADIKSVVSVDGEKPDRSFTMLLIVKTTLGR